jgi:hypothetical protein
MEACGELKSTCGLLGFIDFLSGMAWIGGLLQITTSTGDPFALGRYLIVITRRTLVGRIDEHAIWSVGGTEIIPISASRRHLSPAQVPSKHLRNRHSH